MSKYTSNPGIEVEERAVREGEATNGSNPTAETKQESRMSNSVAPTVSTDKFIRMVNGTSPPAQESGGIGGGQMVIQNTSNVGPMAHGADGTSPTVITRSESDVGGTPTVIEASTAAGPIAKVVSGSNTAELRRLIVGAEGTASVAENGVMPIVAKERLAA